MNFSTARIDEIVEGDEELKQELINLFMETMEKCTKALEESFGKEDHAKIWHDEIHELKGSALNLGFEDLAEYCKKYEYYEAGDEEKQEVVSNLNKIYSEIQQSL